jgi:Transmembrane protein 131-like N-terminal
MKTLALSSLLLVACSGAPFTVAEQSMGDAPADVGATTFPIVLPDAGEASALEASTPLPDVVTSPPPVEASTPDVTSDAAPCASPDVSGPFVLVPSSIDFGAVSLGQRAEGTIQVVNMGACTAAISANGGAISGNRGEFSDSTDCAQKILHPGESCAFYIVFAPTAVGPTSAKGGGLINDQQYSFTVMGEGQ